MDFIGPVCEFVISPLIQPLVSRINYARKINENFKMLKDKKDDLIIKSSDVNEEIERQAMSKVPTKECEAWLKKVKEIEMQVNAVEAELEKESRCLGGWCPNILARMKLGKQIVIMINHVTEVKNETPSGEQLMVDAPLAVVERTPVPFIMGQLIEGTIQDILGCIKDDRTRKIGLWGMGGVGKTTIMKKLESLPEISQMFEIVIWVTVSKDWSFRKLQGDITKRLSLELNEDDSDERVASKIFGKLQTMRYLLLLDDVWKMVDLHKIGVPNPKYENGSKMVLTSRSLGICNEMGTDKQIKVKELPEREAWDLFHENAGEVIDSHDIEGTARGIVKECHGLPLALVVVARSLRNVNDVFVWKNALDELRMATFDVGDMEEQVFKILKTSYDRLKDENVKNCFLYCALYPEDFDISKYELIEYWRAEGFIAGMQNLDMEYNKGHKILNDLIAASLLEELEKEFGEKVVKMHDVIRDLALRITSPKGDDSPRHLVRAGVELRVCPDEEEWEHVNKISLMSNHIHSLPNKPRCTTLTTLSLRNNRNLKEIPVSFFEHMHGLRVLDLADTKIKSLPSSISHLVSLRFLNLSYTDMESLPSSISHLVSLRFFKFVHCDFETLPREIGALKELEVLSTGPIGYFPIEVGQLTKLKTLVVSFYGEHRQRIKEDQERDEEGQVQDNDTSHIQEKVGKRLFPNGMFSNLHLLERFTIVGMLNLDESKWNESADTVAEELGSLEQLTHLEFYFPSIECLEKFTQKRSLFMDPPLTSFQLEVGSRSRHRTICGHENERFLEWTKGDGIPSAIKKIIKQACNFQFASIPTIQSLSEFGIENINGLHVCEISACNGMETIIDGKDLTNVKAALPNMGSLELGSLPNLKSLCKGPILLPIFSSLTSLTVNKCGKLCNVFSSGIIQYLSKLESLDVRNCEEVEEIINERDKEDTVLLPRLEELELGKLPKLVRICKGTSRNWPSLKKIEVLKCPNLKTLPFSVLPNDVPNLQNISGEEEWWEALKWRDDEAKQQFQPLFQLPPEWKLRYYS